MQKYAAWKGNMLLWGTLELLLRVPIRWYRGLDCSTGERQIGCPRLALLTAGIDTGSQRHTETAVELVGARCRSVAKYIEEIVVASGCLASTLVGTGIASCAIVTWSTAGLAHSRSFLTRVGFLQLRTLEPMWKIEMSIVALA